MNKIIILNLIKNISYNYLTKSNDKLNDKLLSEEEGLCISYNNINYYLTVAKMKNSSSSIKIKANNISLYLAYIFQYLEEETCVYYFFGKNKEQYAQILTLINTKYEIFLKHLTEEQEKNVKAIAATSILQLENVKKVTEKDKKLAINEKKLIVYYKKLINNKMDELKKKNAEKYNFDQETVLYNFIRNFVNFYKKNVMYKRYTPKEKKERNIIYVEHTREEEKNRKKYQNILNSVFSEFKKLTKIFESRNINYKKLEKMTFKELNIDLSNEVFFQVLYKTVNESFLLNIIKYSTKYIRHYKSLESLGKSFIRAYALILFDRFLDNTPENKKEREKIKETYDTYIQQFPTHIIELGIMVEEFFCEIYAGLVKREKIDDDLDKKNLNATSTGINHYKIIFDIDLPEKIKTQLQVHTRLPLLFVKPIPWEITDFKENTTENYSGGYAFNNNLKIKSLINTKQNLHKVEFLNSKVKDAINKMQNTPFMINWNQVDFLNSSYNPDYIHKNAYDIAKQEIRELDEMVKTRRQINKNNKKLENTSKKSVDNNLDNKTYEVNKFTDLKFKKDANLELISNYLDQKFLIQDLYALRNLYNSEIEPFELKLKNELKKFDIKIDFKYNLFPENFVCYQPIHLEWRLRLNQMSSIGIYSSSAFRTCMIFPTKYFVDKNDFKLFLMANAQKIESKNQVYINEIFDKEAFYKLPKTEMEINTFIKDKEEPICLRSLIKAYFECQKKETPFGIIEEKTNVFVGLDATSNAFQLQQIAILNAKYSKELNFHKNEETKDKFGDLYAHIITTYLLSLKNLIEKTHISDSDLKKAQNLVDENKKNKYVLVKASKIDFTKPSKLPTFIEFKLQTTIYKKEKSEIKEIKGNFMPLPEGFIVREVYNFLINNKAKLRKILKPSLVAFAYNARVDSTLKPLRQNLRTYIRDIKYKKYFCEYILVSLRDHLVKNLELLDVNSLFHKLVTPFIKFEVPFTYYHLSGALITSNYRERVMNQAKRIFITVAGPKAKRNIVKPSRFNTTFSNSYVSNFKRLAVAASPNWTHSLDSAIVHHVILNYNNVFCIHDCFLIRLSEYKSFYTQFPSFVYTILSNLDNYDTTQNFDKLLTKKNPKVSLLYKHFEICKHFFNFNSKLLPKNISNDDGISIKNLFTPFQKEFAKISTRNKLHLFNLKDLIHATFLKP